MAKKDDYRGSQNWLLSLKKLTGQDVADIEGYITREFGDPVFKISRVILSNGYQFWVEGEHDLPYLTYGGTDLDAFGTLIDALAEDGD